MARCYQNRFDRIRLCSLLGQLIIENALRGSGPFCDRALLKSCVPIVMMTDMSDGSISHELNGDHEDRHPDQP